MIKGPIRDQIEDGGHVHWEWPKDCDGYHLEEVVSMLRRCSFLEAILDGCTVGVKSQRGRPILKPWKKMTTCPLMAKRLSRRCQRNHVHDWCEGSDTARTAYYPQPMANIVVGAMLEQPNGPE
jgi:hypothetical protein